MSDISEHGSRAKLKDLYIDIAKSYRNLFCIHDSAIITAKTHLNIIETDKVNLGGVRMKNHLENHEFWVSRMKHS